MNLKYIIDRELVLQNSLSTAILLEFIIKIKRNIILSTESFSLLTLSVDRIVLSLYTYIYENEFM